MPLYALSADDEPAAVAFAIVREDECRFRGVGSRPDLLPGINAVEESMPVTIAQWRSTLEGLMSDFLDGNATVDPKGGTRTCEKTWCAMQPLCRIDVTVWTDRVRHDFPYFSNL